MKWPEIGQNKVLWFRILYPLAGLNLGIGLGIFFEYDVCAIIVGRVKFNTRDPAETIAKVESAK
jgi:hypothetical protein